MTQTVEVVTDDVVTDDVGAADGVRSRPRRVSMVDLPDLAGAVLGPTEPIVVTQREVDAFADVSHDHQWLHVDPERAAAGPFGGTIVHGFFTVALSTPLLEQLLDVPDAARIVNYGLNKVRFPAPLHVGAPVTMSMRIAAVDAVAGGYQVTYVATFSAVDQGKPVCVLEGLFRYYRGESS